MVLKPCCSRHSVWWVCGRGPQTIVGPSFPALASALCFYSVSAAAWLALHLCVWLVSQSDVRVCLCVGRVCAVMRGHMFILHLGLHSPAPLSQPSSQSHFSWITVVSEGVVAVMGPLFGSCHFAWSWPLIPVWVLCHPHTHKEQTFTSAWLVLPSTNGMLVPLPTAYACDHVFG